MNRRLIQLLLAVLAAVLIASPAQAQRIKDIGSFQGVR